MKQHPHQHFPHPSGATNPKPPAPGKDSAGDTTGSVDSAQQTQHRIAEVAYFIAMKRGFIGGDRIQDWLEAERLVTSGAPHI